MDVRFECMSVRRSHANAARHVVHRFTIYILDGACRLGLPQPTPAGGARWAESGPNEAACSALREKIYPRRMTMRRGPECADMHVRFACASVRRSQANVALHVSSSRHPIKPLHTRSNARVSCLVGHGNRKHESQARCVCAALLSASLCASLCASLYASRR